MHGGQLPYGQGMVVNEKGFMNRVLAMTLNGGFQFTRSNLPELVDRF